MVSTALPNARPRASVADIRAALDEARRLIAAHVVAKPGGQDDALAQFMANYGGGQRDYVAESAERIVYTVQRVLSDPGAPDGVCEIGFGPIGLTYHLVTGRPVTGFDVADAYRPLCQHLGLELLHVDLRRPGSFPVQHFGLALMFEVIEHVDRPPAQILADVRRTLHPGGRLHLSTPNLSRLLNRLRLLLGRPLFADYDPPNLLMAHFREYQRDELRRYLEAAGFRDVRSAFYCQPDTRKGPLVVAAYRAACALRPELANVIFLDATSPA